METITKAPRSVVISGERLSLALATKFMRHNLDGWVKGR